MKIILFLGIFCFFVNNLFAGNILSTQEIKSVMQKNILLKREELKIEKAEKVSNNVVLLNVILNSKKIQFLLIDVDGKSYMFAVETMLSEKVLKELVPQIKNVEKISANLQMLKVLNDKELINIFIVDVDNNSYAFINGIDEKGNAISSAQNRIVKDSETALMWQDEPYTEAEKTAYDKNTNNGKAGNWDYAKAYCENLNLGEYSDWRLPNIFELSTLISVMGISEHHIGIIKNTLSGEVFLSSTISSDGTNISVVNFNTGKTGINGKYSSAFIRCVRGPQLTTYFRKQR